MQKKNTVTVTVIIIKIIRQYCARYQESTSRQWQTFNNSPASMRQESNLRDYQKLAAKKFSVCDLTQYARNGRARGSLQDGSLMTLTTNCSKFWSQDGALPALYNMLRCIKSSNFKCLGNLGFAPCFARIPKGLWSQMNLWHRKRFLQVVCRHESARPHKLMFKALAILQFAVWQGILCRFHVWQLSCFVQALLCNQFQINS